MPGRAFRVAKVAAAFLIAGTLVFMVTAIHRTRYFTLLAAPAAVLNGVVVAAWTRRTGRSEAPAESAARRGHGFTLPVILTTLGVVTWLVHVTPIEPVRSHQRSLDRVAAAFSPYLDDDAALYVDTWDGYAALFIVLERSASIWRLSDPLPSAPLTVVVVDSQIEELRLRSDLEPTFLETAFSPQGQRFTLVNVDLPARR